MTTENKDERRLPGILIYLGGLAHLYVFCKGGNHVGAYYGGWPTFAPSQLGVPHPFRFLERVGTTDAEELVVWTHPDLPPALNVH
jgi:hypothetical protein